MLLSALFQAPHCTKKRRSLFKACKDTKDFLIHQALPHVIRCQLESFLFGRWRLEHGIGHDSLADGTESAGAQLVLQGGVYDNIHHLRLNLQGNAVQLKHLLVLPQEGVLGLSEDALQGIAVQLVQVSTKIKIQLKQLNKPRKLKGNISIKNTPMIS